MREYTACLLLNSVVSATDRSLKPLDLVLSATASAAKTWPTVPPANKSMGDYDTFLFLKEKIPGLPHVDVMTAIN